MHIIYNYTSAVAKFSAPDLLNILKICKKLLAGNPAFCPISGISMIVTCGKAFAKILLYSLGPIGKLVTFNSCIILTNL